MVTLNCQAIMQGISELPKDEMINTFHFTDSTGDSAVQAGQLAAARISAFYSAAHSVAALMSFLASTVDPTITVKCYDVAAPEPRPIVYQGHFAIPAATGASLPTEVALCLSYYTDRNIVGHRGRLYIGPLSTFCLDASGSNPRPDATLVSSMRQAALQLANPEGDTVAGNLVTDVTTVGSAGTGIPKWVLASRNGVHAGPIVYNNILGGWIDNEWDTQRRRRIASTARTTWSLT